jgi:hypothetical protein
MEVSPMRVPARVAALALALTAAALAAPQPDAPPAATSPAFESLKSLAGTWTGTAAWDEAGQKGGGEITIVYRLTAAGTAVEETMSPGTPHEMVTVYHMDGQDVVLTHYCAAGNQPRMRLEGSSDPKVLSFRFIGGSNMKESDMHMHSAQITLVDADHIQGLWTSMKDGKAAGQASFDLARKK